MERVPFLSELCARVSAEEQKALLTEPCTLDITSENRASILEMLALNEQQKCSATLCGRPVNTESAQELEQMLVSYLHRYMDDRPEAHKWIILVCLYKAFVVREPMHPVNRAGVVIRQNGEETLYYCPAREEGPDSVCKYCVCRPKNEIIQ